MTAPSSTSRMPANRATSRCFEVRGGSGRSRMARITLSLAMTSEDRTTVTNEMKKPMAKPPVRLLLSKV